MIVQLFDVDVSLNICGDKCAHYFQVLIFSILNLKTQFR